MCNYKKFQRCDYVSFRQYRRYERHIRPIIAIITSQGFRRDSSTEATSDRTHKSCCAAQAKFQIRLTLPFVRAPVRANAISHARGRLKIRTTRARKREHGFRETRCAASWPHARFSDTRRTGNSREFALPGSFARSAARNTDPGPERRRSCPRASGSSTACGRPRRSRRYIRR